MGTWGPGIFDSDMALDVENVFEEALDDGLNIRQASQKVLEYFADDVKDDDDGPVIYLALAGLQMQYEDLSPALRSKVLALLEAGGGMELWEGGRNEAERQQVLEQFRWLLSTFPEPPETPRPLAPRPPKQAFGPGDLVRIPLPEGRMAFGRVLYEEAFGVYAVVSAQQENPEALRRPNFNDLLQHAVEPRRQVLVADRQVMLARDSAREGAAPRRWLAGIDQRETASSAVLAATISYPAV